ncbi:SRPBCC family protein [Actinoallomurus sp. CA-150999]|uniref:SRPBCC family protein n=1 Tax=Actinoallomurus sp. CA-150999 TaxID=3239887 RepID=UPI003D9001BA
MDEVTIWIDARPEAVWELVADITRYGEWSPENQGGRWSGDPGHGARFTGANRKGIMRWSTHCEVIEYDRPSRFAFEVNESRMRWGYRLEPQNGGTRVTEWNTPVGRPPLPIRIVEATGLLGRDRRQARLDGMRQTLQKIKDAAENGRARPHGG